MKKINKKVLIIVITLVLIVSCGIGGFAYYSATSNQAVTAGTTIADENVIEIASFDQLFTYSKAETYNDKNIVSDSEDRIILKLTDNVTLVSDLEVTADVHFNLNGKTLNLNDYELSFRHGYAGCFALYRGTVQNGTVGNGKITIDLPNASFVTDNVAYNHSGTALTQDDVVNILSIDSKYTAYRALYYVSDSIGSDLNSKIELEDYDTVSDEDYTITQDKFITTKDTCVYNSNSIDVCSFAYKDLDLPMHYLSTDVSITYTSSNENIVSNKGKVTIPSTTADVTLTATINHESWDNPVSCAFKLHVVNLSNQTVKNNIANQLIKAYLAPYYVEGDLVVNETTTISGYYYEFKNGLQLPLSALDGSITYSYTMTDYNNTLVNTTSSANGNAYLLQPNDNCYHLVVRINNNTNLTLNMYSQYVGDKETIARLILNKLYGGSIIFDSSETEKELYRYSELGSTLDSTTYSYVTAYNITGLTYSLKTGSEALDYYSYSNYVLSLNDNIPPVKTSYLTASFTFGTGANAEVVDVDLYINYLAESGDTLAGFLPYYNLYDPMVAEQLTSSFEMPFSFGTGAPYICYDFSYDYELDTTTENEEVINYYDFTLGKPAGLKIVLYYNGAERFTFSAYSSQTSFTSQLDSYLTSAGVTLRQIAEYGDAKYIFKIDAQNATVDDVETLLIYNYKFNPASNWRRYDYTINGNSYVTELTSSLFTVCGGLFYNSSVTQLNCVKDSNFFTWIYNNFNPNGDTITASSVNSDSFIPTLWLSIDVALDYTQDSSLSSVNDYSGIGLLKSITKVNLSGVTLTANVISGLSSMTSVTELRLSGCGLTSITNICTMNTVKVLDVSNNGINKFDDLIKMKNLEEVYVYSNNATTNNPINGSLGITNFQTYNDLIKKGIAVFNQVSDGIPVLYTDSDDYNDYAKIKSIIYQNKLSTDVSIESVYSMFRNFTATSFDLQNTGGTLTWNYQTSDEDGNTYTEYTATYFYAQYVFNNNTLIVKFYVDRY